MTDVICASCPLGAHNCADIICHPTLGVVSCACGPCFDANRAEFEAEIAAAIANGTYAGDAPQT